MTDPFRSELEAAHQRIERMEADHQARIADLERENKRLRARLVDVAPSRTKTGRTFFAVGMMTLALSIAGGIVFARMRAPPHDPPPNMREVAMIEIENGASPTPADFDRDAVATSLAGVGIDDCVDANRRPGTGHVVLMIAPTGVVMTAKVDKGIYASTSEGRCIEERFRAVHVRPWTGTARMIGKAFDVH